jgi:hypothetical protein
LAVDTGDAVAVLALVLSALAAYYTGQWMMMGVGFLAGIMASAEAAKAHVKAAAEPPTPTVP